MNEREPSQVGFCLRVEACQVPHLLVRPEDFLERKQVLYAPLFSPQVVMPEHMHPLGREDQQVVRVVVIGITIDVMHHFSRGELPAQLPLRHRPVKVVTLTRAFIQPQFIAAHASLPSVLFAACRFTMRPTVAG